MAKMKDLSSAGYSRIDAGRLTVYHKADDAGTSVVLQPNPKGRDYSDKCAAYAGGIVVGGAKYGLYRVRILASPVK